MLASRRNGASAHDLVLRLSISIRTKMGNPGYTYRAAAAGARVAVAGAAVAVARRHGEGGWY